MKSIELFCLACPELYVLLTSFTVVPFTFSRVLRKCTEHTFYPWKCTEPGQRANPHLSCEPCFHSTMWCLFKFDGQFPCLLGESTSLQLEVYFSLLFSRSSVNWPDHEDMLVPVSSQWLQRL